MVNPSDVTTFTHVLIMLFNVHSKEWSTNRSIIIRQGISNTVWYCKLVDFSRNYATQEGQHLLTWQRALPISGGT